MEQNQEQTTTTTTTTPPRPTAAQLITGIKIIFAQIALAAVNDPAAVAGHVTAGKEMLAELEEGLAVQMEPVPIPAGEGGITTPFTSDGNQPLPTGATINVAAEVSPDGAVTSVIVTDAAPVNDTPASTAGKKRGGAKTE